MSPKVEQNLEASSSPLGNVTRRSKRRITAILLLFIVQVVVLVQYIKSNSLGASAEIKTVKEPRGNKTSEVDNEQEHDQNEARRVELDNHEQEQWRNETSKVEQEQEHGGSDQSKEGQKSEQRGSDEQSNVHPPLNVLLLYADDWAMKTLGILSDHVKTPYLDQLARSGMLFTDNCVTTSICWISRATLLTGQYASVHGQDRIMSEKIFGNHVWNQTLFYILKEHGYYTGLVGKWHAPGIKHRMKEAFSQVRSYQGKHKILRGNETKHVTALNKEDSLWFLQTRPRDKPFALWVSFFATHAQDHKPFPHSWEPMDESMSMYYANETLPVPKTNTQKHWEDLPWFLHDVNEGRRRYVNRFDTPDRFQVSMKNLLRMATEVDQVCGELIQELKQQGVYNNTLIIFTTDNGMLHGEHGMSDKWYAFEESIKVPLIVHDPRMPSNMHGKTNGDFTLSIDLAPTILSAAQIPVPSGMQGRDISPLYMKEAASASASWRQDFFYEWTQGGPDAVHHPRLIPAVFALVKKGYKYVYWPQSQYEQLFDNARDPFEENDIYNDTATTNSEMLLEMKARYAHLKESAQGGSPM
jgi:arylsulfatase